MPKKLTKRERAFEAKRLARWIVTNHVPIVITQDKTLIWPDWDVFEEMKRLLADEASS